MRRPRYWASPIVLGMAAAENRAPRRPRATPWTSSDGCYERHDAATGERVAFVNPEPGVPEWRWEVIVDGAVAFGSDVVPDTAEAACAAADEMLRSLGWDLTTGENL